MVKLKGCRLGALILSISATIFLPSNDRFAAWKAGLVIANDFIGATVKFRKHYSKQRRRKRAGSNEMSSL